MQNEPSQCHEPSPENRPFRFNAKVAQFVIIVLLAMALPIAVVVLGFLEMRKAMREETPEALVEPPGLRTALEQAVDAAWSAPVNLGGTAGKFEQTCRTGDECLRLGDEAKKIAAGFGGVVITPERIEQGGTRWIIQVPSAKAQDFESALVAMGFRMTSALPSDSQGEAALYELEIHIAK